jgi:activating signal cointegrator 1
MCRQCDEMELFYEQEAQSRVIKVISLWQPWAEAMKRGLKRNETRSWCTGYRGWLAIHAAKRKPDAVPARFGTVALGAIVCIVRLVNCIRTGEIVNGLSEEEESWGDYSPGRWAWQTESLIALPEAIPLRGHQGLFDWQMPEEIAQLTIGSGQLVGRDPVETRSGDAS